MKAVGELLKASFLNRSSEHKALSVYRLVQSTVFARLSNDERSFYLNSTITLLSNGFPNTWKKTGSEQGHGWASWKTCSEVVPHVSWLIKLAEKHKLKASGPEKFAELVFRAGT